VNFHLINKISKTHESVISESVEIAEKIASLSPDAIIVTRHGYVLIFSIVLQTNFYFSSMLTLNPVFEKPGKPPALRGQPSEQARGMTCC
jgi:hypothetical protein